MKRENAVTTLDALSRTPYGVRGLKLRLAQEQCNRILSHSVRGAWVETSLTFAGLFYSTVAPRTGCVG